jgi:hypothetical protein
MLTDPFSVTYDGNAKSLARISLSPLQSRYRTADGEFEIQISSSPKSVEPVRTVSFLLARRLPDPTPADVFDAYREIRNGVSISFMTDTTRAGSSVDLPLLRTALLATVDSTLQGRLIAGEK